MVWEERGPLCSLGLCDVDWPHGQRGADVNTSSCGQWRYA